MNTEIPLPETNDDLPWLCVNTFLENAKDHIHGMTLALENVDQSCFEDPEPSIPWYGLVTLKRDGDKWIVVEEDSVNAWPEGKDKDVKHWEGLGVCKALVIAVDTTISAYGNE